MMIVATISGTTIPPQKICGETGGKYAGAALATIRYTNATKVAIVIKTVFPSFNTLSLPSSQKVNYIS